MFTAYQLAMLGLEFVMTIVAVWGVVAKSQAVLKAELHGAIKEVTEAHGTSLSESRQQFSAMNKSFEQVGLQINTIMEGHVRDLQSRVTRLESGQDEWTKELRQRTHDLSGKVDLLGFAVELLKAGKQRKDGV
jgi:TolA-binding protein